MRLDHLLSKENKLYTTLVLRVFFVNSQKTCGGVAQLGEHLPCTQGVASSNLVISTMELEKYIKKKKEIRLS